MRRKRAPWLLWLSLGLLALLASLAVLQYRLLGHVSEAERERMQASLRSRAEQFAGEFDREVARAYFLLQVEPDSKGGVPGARYAERYDRWRSAAAHPRLVSAVWLFAPGTAPRRYDVEKRTFETAPVPDALQKLWHEARANLQNREAKPVSPLRWYHAVREEIPAIVAPIPEFVSVNNVRTLRIEQVRPLARRGFTVVLLDDRYLREDLLPTLAARHFGSADTADYHMSIASRDPRREVFAFGPRVQPAEATPDITLDLFDVRLDALADLVAAHHGAERVTFAQRAPPPARGKVVLVQPRAGPAPPSEVERRFTVSMVDAPARGRVMERMSIPGPRWRLELRHRAGSLEAAVARARWRNLVLSSGILALLGTTLIVLVVSAQRASRLAAQQIEFVAAVTHELRTPLAVIRSAGENLADGVVSDPAQVRKYGDLVRSEGRRLTSMVEQVLAFAGMRGGDALRLRPEQARELIDRAVEISRAELDAAGLQVEIQVPPDLPAAIVDADAVVRALANLIANAAKYARSGAWVGISAAVARAAGGCELQLTVSDRGPGIAPDDLPHIFEPFYRASAVVASPTHGSGLGLSLVDAIARAHGGRVTVRTNAGEGTAFTLHLPCEAAAAGAPAGTPATASRS